MKNWHYFFFQNKLVTPSEVINFHIDFYALSDFQLVWLTACQDWRKGYSMKLYRTAVQKKNAICLTLRNYSVLSSEHLYLVQYNSYMVLFLSMWPIYWSFLKSYISVFVLRLGGVAFSVCTQRPAKESHVIKNRRSDRDCFW